MERPDVTGLRNSGKALEESFFAKENARLLEKLNKKKAEAAKREAFKEVANIESDELIDALMALELEVSDLAALSIVPLVEVAWADGEIQSKERKAILKAAEEVGITPGAENYELLVNWLERKPEAKLMECWSRYARDLEASLDSALGAVLRDRLMARTRKVAEAAGGFLGIGAISDAEQAVLDDLEKALA
jgi:hypothetical protein